MTLVTKKVRDKLNIYKLLQGSDRQLLDVLHRRIMGSNARIAEEVAEHIWTTRWLK